MPSWRSAVGALGGKAYRWEDLLRPGSILGRDFGLSLDHYPSCHEGINAENQRRPSATKPATSVTNSVYTTVVKEASPYRHGIAQLHADPGCSLRRHMLVPSVSASPWLA